MNLKTLRAYNLRETAAHLAELPLEQRREAFAELLGTIEAQHNAQHQFIAQPCLAVNAGPLVWAAARALGVMDGAGGKTAPPWTSTAQVVPSWIMDSLVHQSQAIERVQKACGFAQAVWTKAGREIGPGDVGEAVAVPMPPAGESVKPH